MRARCLEDGRERVARIAPAPARSQAAVPLRALFERPTVAAFAESLLARADGADDRRVDQDRRGEPDAGPRP